MTEAVVSQRLEHPTVGECIDEALQLEGSNPRKALDLYRLAKRADTVFSPLVFFVALIGPPAASMLALFLAPRFGTVVGGAVIAYLGFGPASLMRIALDSARGVGHQQTRRVSVVNLILAGPYYMFEQVLVCLTAVFGLVMVLGPLVGVLLLLDGRGWEMTEPQLLALEVLVAVATPYALLAVLADMWYGDLWPPISGLRYLFAHLKANSAGVFGYIAVLFTGHLFAVLEVRPAGFFLDPELEVLIAGSLSGVFLAIALSRGDRTLEWKARIRLGLCRCNIRERRWGAARVPLRQMFTEDTCAAFAQKTDQSLCGLLSNQLFRLTEGIREGYRPGGIDVFLQEADEILEEEARCRRVWRPEVEANRRLVADDTTQDALEQSVKRRRLPDLSGLLILYWCVGFGCFLWWLHLVSRSL